jgi:NAD(P)-dependent dehydrogenase (short-subunit alcohol dehydrogenase family)
MRDVHKLSGRSALVTGASRGIGRAIAVRLGADGASVAVHYRRDEQAAVATVDEVRRLGAEADLFQASVESGTDVEELVEAVERRFGPIGILVSNAGMLGKGRSIYRTAINELDRLLQIHAVGPFRLCQLVLPGMRSCERGDIVFVSSHGTSQFSPGAGPYNIAKAAAEALARTLANEERVNGIRVNIVAPGLVATDMGDAVARATSGAGSAAELDSDFPFGRVCRPDDVSAVVGFLVSDDGSYLTGVRIPVDGGET